MSKRTFTDAERADYRADKRRQQREDLERAARELLSSEGWTRYAETRAKFHRYSFGNCMLIAMQCPHASEVAGFHRWRELGRKVRKGERGIRILAPMVVKRRESDESDETGETLVTFRGVSVFDISQTDGEPLPAPPAGEPLTGDSHAEYLERLTAWAHQRGITVRLEPIDGAARGYWQESERLIVIDPDGPANRHVRTLVHELAHSLGTTYREYGREIAEVLTETAAYIVCGAIGLDTAGESVPYVAGWGESGSDLKAIREHAERVDAIARELEGACGLEGARKG